MNEKHQCILRTCRWLKILIIALTAIYSFFLLHETYQVVQEKGLHCQLAEKGVGFKCSP